MVEYVFKLEIVSTLSLKSIQSFENNILEQNLFSVSSHMLKIISYTIVSILVVKIHV